jgi:hypothetical protein
MIKYSILTYIIGNYEIVREVDYDISTTPHIEYVLVTDNPKLKSNTYKVIFDEELANSEMDNWGKVLQVRYNPFKYVSNDICIRIDGSMQVCAPMDNFIEQLVKENYDGGILLHPTRTNILDEYDTWIKRRNLDVNSVNKDLDKINLLFNYDYKIRGLYQVGFQILRNNYLHNFINNLMLFILKNDDGTYSRVDQTIYSAVINSLFLSTKWLLFTNKFLLSDYVKYYLHKKPILVDKNRCKTMEISYFRNEIVSPIY